ncbi:yaaA [Symbiodinium sp. CCMP2456]|nr:yaaA [Symbiodinium sp. CCMP2456]
MLALLSPAKTLDMSPSATTTKSTPSALLSKRTEEILASLKKMPAKELKKMMKLSDELAKQTAERFAKFKAQPSKASCLAFDGPAFRGFAAKSFSKADEKQAQASVRILCALYGVLKPYDLIRPPGGGLIHWREAPRALEAIPPGDDFEASRKDYVRCLG